jgi:hypothetical protein
MLRLSAPNAPEKTSGGTHFAIINIGANLGHKPMAPETWEAFKADVTEVLSSYGCLVGVGTGTSQWGGSPEAFATFHVLVDDRRLLPLRATLGDLAGRYGQDSIALVLAEDASLISAPVAAA